MIQLGVSCVFDANVEAQWKGFVYDSARIHSHLFSPTLKNTFVTEGPQRIRRRSHMPLSIHSVGD